MVASLVTRPNLHVEHAWIYFTNKIFKAKNIQEENSRIITKPGLQSGSKRPRAYYLVELFRISSHIHRMAEAEGPRRRATQSWQHLSVRPPASDAGWAIIWDTRRKAEMDGRNTAIEKSEAAALERSRHLLRMGFVVYEIREPSGAVFLMEADIRARVGLRPESPVSPQTPVPTDLETSAAEDSLRGDDLAQAMIDVHGNRAAGVARENARAAVTAGQVVVAKNWLKVIEAIQLRKPGVI